MGLKKEVARRLVSRYNGEEAGAAALDRFQRVVQAKELPDDIPEVALSLDGRPALSILEALEQLGLTKSRGESRRVARQGGLTVDGDKVEDPTLPLAAGTYLIRVGRRRFTRLTLE